MKSNRFIFLDSEGNKIIYSKETGETIKKTLWLVIVGGLPDGPLYEEFVNAIKTGCQFIIEAQNEEEIYEKLVKNIKFIHIFNYDHCYADSKKEFLKQIENDSNFKKNIIKQIKQCINDNFQIYITKLSDIDLL